MSANTSVTGHEFLEHVGELEIRIWAPALDLLFVEAGRALSLELLRGAVGPPAESPLTLEVAAVDRAALLVEFLNELIYRADAEGHVLTSFEFTRLTDTELSCSGRGVRLAIASSVKAATYHELALAPRPEGGFTARVTLDI
jgi:SHS2 domain-containing protein